MMKAHSSQHLAFRGQLVFVFALFAISYALIASAALAQDATTSESVRDRVRKTIENLTKRPRAVIGNLESIADATLKIKTEEGKLVLVATSDKTTYSKTAVGKKAEVEFADLAIGNFVAALGYKNGNDIIDAKRVLAYDEAPFPKKQAVYGEVETNKKGILTIKHPKNSEVWTVETTAKTEVTKKVNEKMEGVLAAEIEEGDRIIAAGVPSAKKDKTLLSTRVHVIPGKATGFDNPNPTPKPKVSPLPSPKVSPKPSPTPVQ